MADVDDPHNYERRVEKELGRLEQAAESGDVSEATVEAAEEFATAQRKGRVPDDNDLSLSSLSTYLKYLRYTAVDVDGPLPEASKDDLVDYLELVGYENSASYHNANISALYAFSDYHDLGWREYDFEFIITDTSKVDPSRLFTDEEVNAMLDEAGVRGRAMVALLADTGCRIGALASFRIRDLDLSGEVPQLAFNTDGNVKTADGKVLLSWSVGHLETYLNAAHPQPDEPNAPVIHKKKNYEKDDPSDAAVSPSRLRKDLKDIGEAAGLARDRVRPHNFRHTAVSNWIRQGYSVDEIVHRASWAGPKMLKIYDNVTDEQRNEDLAVKMGLVEDEQVATDPSEATIKCPRCNSTVRRNANFCGSCGLQMSRAPLYEDDDVDPATIDEDASSDPEPAVPEDAWPDGGTDILEEVPDEVLLQHLLKKSDVDASELLDE